MRPGRVRQGYKHRRGMLALAQYGWRSSLGMDRDEVSDQLVRTGIPPSADLTPEHHELLGDTHQRSKQPQRSDDLPGVAFTKSPGRPALDDL